jgi:serine/threonine protein kinase
MICRVCAVLSSLALPQGVYEDDEHVHIVMELCRGGELSFAIGQRHYSERTVASYMRAVLRTLAQCHAAHILHRDIKPGNFMLLSDDERSPLRAIDFGLATPYDPAELPLTDLGLEGGGAMRGGAPWLASSGCCLARLYLDAPHGVLLSLSFRKCHVIA